MNDVHELQEVVNGESWEVVGQDKDPGLCLDILPDPHSASLQFAFNVLPFQLTWEETKRKISFSSMYGKLYIM